MRDNYYKFLERMKPKYNELDTFLMALSCIILFIIHPEFRHAYSKIYSQAGPIGMSSIILGVMGTIGLILSIIHVLTYRQKSRVEKTFMGVFALGANGLAGIAAGIEIMPIRWSIWVLLPIVNIFMGVLTLYEIGLLNDVITDENVSPLQVVIASIVLLVVFVISYFGFHLKWAMIFSISMFFSYTIPFVMFWAIDYLNYRGLAKA